MASYAKSEARDWARDNMAGVANVVIPTFTDDLRNLNENAIRFDIRKEIEFGFYGTLLVSEVAISVAEYLQFTAWAAEEAAGGLCLIHHASFNTLDENVEAVKGAEAAGADLVLLSYPSNFHPRSQQDIYDYTRDFCAATNLGVMLFPVPLWGFERLHPAGMDPAMVKRMIADIPNIVAIKAESGMPTIAGFVQAWKTFADEVVVTFPIEDNGLPLAALVPMRFMGTSNSEFYGSMIPRIFRMMQSNDFDSAMELYWQIHPARMANIQASAYMPMTSFLHRPLWKFQGWLAGFNGGPLRQPTMRINHRQMAALRAAREAAGFSPTPEPDEAYYRGRNPA